MKPETIFDICKQLPSTKLLIEQCENLDKTVDKLVNIYVELDDKYMKLLSENISLQNKLIDVMFENNNLKNKN